MATDPNKPVCADEFWNYSLAFYTDSLNQEDLIYLQDSFGFNVNMILLVMYLQAKGLFVAAIDLQAIKQKNEDLDSLTFDFRKKRRALKADNICKGLADYKTLEYQKLLDQELGLEKQQQVLMIELAQDVCKTLHNNKNRDTTFANFCALVEPVPDNRKEELRSIFARLIDAQATVADEFLRKSDA